MKKNIGSESSVDEDVEDYICLFSNFVCSHRWNRFTQKLSHGEVLRKLIIVISN